jgi:non-specific serine/threonine protein kinase
MVGDTDTTQHDVGDGIAAELSRAGFADADEIGRGGFGIVYRCVQSALDRVVAVKVLTVEVDDSRERFVREQQAMGRLTGHPNIVAVLQTGETPSGYSYLVMPYCESGSLQDRIRLMGVLPLDEVLRFGVKLAGALESAHRSGIVHRDVKPANVLLTDYREPALCDFGIARTAGAYKTATGIFTGSPAFTAPEVLSGDEPSSASDVYGLGATLFAALTGHAAFERRSGEQVVAQFLRIANDPVPDLRERGIPDDVAAVIEQAMSREAGNRPSAVEFGEALRDLQSGRGLAVDEMALRGADSSAPRPAARVPQRPPVGNLRTPLASFVGRHAELAELRKLLSRSRLVTLTGVGGVGKTTLSVHAATDQRQSFEDGVWLVELADLRDGSLLVEVVAAALGVRNQSGVELIDHLIELWRPREALVVLDNCEHLIDAAAELVETLLSGCPLLRILATSREVLGVGGEAVLSLSPLPCPEPDTEPTLGGLSRFDAVELFVERARSVVSDFVLTDANRAAVTRICSRLDGLPLALELAAARLRTLSPQQIADGLSDRYTLLGRGRRRVAARQQTLEWCVGWSYDLCSPDEQKLWGRLSVFAGSFELDAAHDICGQNLSQDEFLDELSALVDKSILIRTDEHGEIRFRLLETLRDYGKARIADSADYALLRRRHAGWFARLLADARAQWFGDQQVSWIHRLNREMPNIREALRFTVSDSPATALEMAAAVRPYLFARGMQSEAIRWLDLALDAAPPEPTPQRVQALCGAAWILPALGDVETTLSRIAEARRLLEVIADPAASAVIDCSDGFAALHSGDIERARSYLERALAATDDYEVRVVSTILMGWLHDIFGNQKDSLNCFENVLTLAESRGESLWRSVALACVGVARWRLGDSDRAEQALRQGLQLSQIVSDHMYAAQCLLGLAWVAGSNHHQRRAVMLMAAATALTHAIGAPLIAFAHLGSYHEECERRAREELDPAAFDAAWQDGSVMPLDEVVALALSNSGE